jgi:hypothetical protein
VQVKLHRQPFSPSTLRRNWRVRTAAGIVES